jgi:hypothetical protein
MARGGPPARVELALQQREEVGPGGEALPSLLEVLQVGWRGCGVLGLMGGHMRFPDSSPPRLNHHTHQAIFLTP